MLIFYRPCKCRCPKQHTVDQEARAVGVAVVVGDKIRFPDKIQHQMTRHYPQDQMHLIILENGRKAGRAASAACGGGTSGGPGC